MAAQATTGPSSFKVESSVDMIATSRANAKAAGQLTQSGSLRADLDLHSSTDIVFTSRKNAQINAELASTVDCAIRLLVLPIRALDL